MTSLSIGIAGCGIAGLGHARGYHHAGGRRAFVWDIRPEAAEALAVEYGATALPTFEALIRHPEIAAIIIATPNHTHADLAIQALEAGKHVLLEKPLALTREDAQAVLATARLHDRILHIGFELRNSGFPLMVKELIANGELGPLVSAQVAHYRGHFWPQWKGDRQKGGTMYLMEDCHVIDLFRWWTGDEVSTIHAVGTRRNIVRHYDYPDAQFTTFVFRNGFVGHITDCHTRSAVPPDEDYESGIADRRYGHQYEYSLIGENGALYYEAPQDTCHLYRHLHRADGSTVQELVRTVRFSNFSQAIHNGDAQMTEFLEHIAGKRPPLIDPCDALQTHLVCYAAWDALESGCPKSPETIFGRDAAQDHHRAATH